MDKTIVVKVTRTLKHSVFGKVLKQAKKYKVHDEQAEAQVGDLVSFRECRPLSKTKHAQLVKVITRKAV